MRSSPSSVSARSPVTARNRETGRHTPHARVRRLPPPVDAFPAGVCGPVWHRDPRSMLERFVERAAPLFAVIEGPQQTVDYGVPRSLEVPTGDYRVIFTAEPAGEVVPYIAIVSDRKLSSLKLGCGKPAEALLSWLDPAPLVVRRGPAFVATSPRSEPTPFPSPGSRSSQLSHRAQRCRCGARCHGFWRSRQDSPGPARQRAPMQLRAGDRRATAVRYW